MRIRFFNALIIKNFDDDPFYGEIVIKDNLIEYVGKEKYSVVADKEIDANKNIIMPSFINCHTHCAMSLFKGLSDNASLSCWLNKMQKMEYDLSADDVYNGTALACLELIKNGITTVNDNYFFADRIAECFNNVGLRAVVATNINYSPKKYLNIYEMEDLYKKITSYNLITSNFYCHSVFNNCEEDFALIEKLSKKYNTFVGSHVSETLEEVGNCTATNNDLTPVQLLNEYGFFDNKTLIAHAVHTFPEDLDIIANGDNSIALNLGSNIKLASGLPPIMAMSARNINLCLGTDGSASNNRLDMFQEMYLVASLSKIINGKAEAISSREILKMATINGAKALQLNKVGILEEGFFADLIMIDANSVENAICNDIFSNLVFALNSGLIKLTMCNGKILYENGNFLFLNKEQIFDNAKKSLSNILSNLEKEI